jgi:hypothetical protein
MITSDTSERGLGGAATKVMITVVASLSTLGLARGAPPTERARADAQDLQSAPSTLAIRLSPRFTVQVR